MTAPLGRAHTDAVLALLTGDVVYDGEVPENPTLPYTVLYADLGTAVRTSLSATSGRLEVAFQVTAVAETREQAQWAADEARADILDVRPSVAGRSSTPIVQTSSQPLQRDDDVTPPRMYAVATYAFATVPA